MEGKLIICFVAYKDPNLGIDLKLIVYPGFTFIFSCVWDLHVFRLYQKKVSRDIFITINLFFTKTSHSLLKSVFPSPVTRFPLSSFSLKPILIQF